MVSRLSKLWLIQNHQKDMKIKLVLAFLIVAFCADAQHFTYITDRVFQQPYDLIGYTFIPNRLEIPDVKDPDNNEMIDLDLDDYEFKISGNYIYIKGEMVEGAYSLNSINPTDYGYVIATMNARDPSVQGHLKLILNKENQVEALIFKKARKAKELIFHLAEVDEETSTVESAYFTNTDNPPVTSDIVYGRGVTPFIVVGEEQSRLRIEDSLSIEIKSDTIQIKKKKKTKTVIKEYIRFNYQGKDKFGVAKAFVDEYPIKRIKELRNTTDDGSPHQYLIEFRVANLKSKKILMYLNKKRAISMIEIGRNQFLIKGY